MFVGGCVCVVGGCVLLGGVCCEGGELEIQRYNTYVNGDMKICTTDSQYKKKYMDTPGSW